MIKLTLNQLVLIKHGDNKSDNVLTMFKISEKMVLRFSKNLLQGQCLDSELGTYYFIQNI